MKQQGTDLTSLLRLQLLVKLGPEVDGLPSSSALAGFSRPDIYTDTKSQLRWSRDWPKSRMKSRTDSKSRCCPCPVARGSVLQDMSQEAEISCETSLSPHITRCKCEARGAETLADSSLQAVEEALKAQGSKGSRGAWPCHVFEVVNHSASKARQETGQSKARNAIRKSRIRLRIEGQSAAGPRCRAGRGPSGIPVKVRHSDAQRAEDAKRCKS